MLVGNDGQKLGKSSEQLTSDTDGFCFQWRVSRGTLGHTPLALAGLGDADSHGLAWLDVSIVARLRNQQSSLRLVLFKSCSFIL